MRFSSGFFSFLIFSNGTKSESLDRRYLEQFKLMVAINISELHNGNWQPHYFIIL